MCTFDHTQSDKARTEVLFNTLIEAWINEILPALEEAEKEEAELDEDEQEVVVRLNNFFCGLHSLVHYAEVADKAALALEENHYGGKENIPILNPAFRQAGESGAARTVRLICKSLSRGGDEKSGVYDKAVTYFRAILQEEFGTKTLPFTQYLRNRFSIFFHNCSVTYCLYDHLVDFF